MPVVSGRPVAMVATLRGSGRAQSNKCPRYRDFQEAVMKRYAALSLSLVLALLVPAVASAQKDNKYTKEASKYIGLAMAKPDAESRVPLYQQALTHLEEGMAKEPDHAKTWLLAGQTYVGLNRFQAADSAFDRALELHPEYAEEITGEREQGWIQAFNIGAELMNQNKLPEAVAALELAQEIYAERPEGLMNLGALYTSQNELDKAEAAFHGARQALAGPLVEKLGEEQKAQWARFDEMARINLAQIEGQRGVEHFQAKAFAEAAEAFRKAGELNPYSRDFVFNRSQSVWAQTSAIEEKFDSLPAAQQADAKKAAAPELIELYTQLESVTTEVLELDPLNELLYVIMARAHRMLGEYSGDEAKLAKAQEETMALLEKREALPLELSDIMISTEEGHAVVRGTVKNKKLTAGAIQEVTFQLFGIDGRVVGEGPVGVTLPEADQSSSFEGRFPVTGEIAGWKYVVN